MRAFFPIILLFPLVLAAQTDPAAAAPLPNPWLVKIAVLEAINPFQQTLGGQVDIPLARRLTVDLGAGWIFHSASQSRNQDERYEGYKLRPGVKFFLGRRAGGADHIGLIFKYNDVRNDRYFYVLRQGGQYVENMLVRKRFLTRGVAFRAGTQVFFGAKRQFVFEFTGGLGIRRLDISYENLPIDAEVEEFRGPFQPERSPGSYIRPDMVLGIGLGVALW